MNSSIDDIQQYFWSIWPGLQSINCLHNVVLHYSLEIRITIYKHDLIYPILASRPSKAEHMPGIRLTGGEAIHVSDTNNEAYSMCRNICIFQMHELTMLVTLFSVTTIIISPN